jgi:hypothetical protein
MLLLDFHIQHILYSQSWIILNRQNRANERFQGNAADAAALELPTVCVGEPVEVDEHGKPTDVTVVTVREEHVVEGIPLNVQATRQGPTHIFDLN